MKTLAITLAVLVALTAPSFAKRAHRAQSDISSKYSQRDDGIAQNFK